MTKTLQKKFVLVAMTAISVLLVAVIGGINIASYCLLSQQEAVLLERISQNGGRGLPPGEPPPGAFRPPDAAVKAMGDRFFVAYCTEEGEILALDLSRVQTTITEEEAQQYTAQALEEQQQEGTVGPYAYRIALDRSQKGWLVVFLDVSTHRYYMLMVAMISLLTGGVCWALMLLLVIALSKRAILPILENIEKQKQFVTNAGHEIKTPLAIIQTNIDALELYNGENKWSRNIRTQVKRLTGLMQNLLTLAKMEEGGVKFGTAEVDLSQLVEEMLPPFGEAARSREIRLETEIAPQLVRQGNREYLSQLVSILLDNAVKYARPGGWIRVEARRERHGLLLQVSNCCDQLPKGEPERLFERFYRDDDARTHGKSGGYGIGLSAARAITEAHGGSITAAYQQPDVVTFTVKL